MEEFLGRMKSLLGGEYDEFLKYYEAEHFRGLRKHSQVQSRKARNPYRI